MKRAALLLTFLILSFHSLYALDQVAIEVMTGATWLHNEAYGINGANDKDPDPIIYRLSVAVPLYFTESIYFNPGLAFSGKSWQWVEQNGWAMPVDPMWQDLYVMSFDLDLPFGYQLNFDKFSASVFGGPSFHFRIPLWGANQSERDNMTSYFLSEGRFINLNAGLSFLVPISETMLINIKGETSIPFYNIWNSVDLPFSDGLSVSLTAGVRFILP